MDKEIERQKRIAFYSEIGQFFSPDATFNRHSFQQTLAETYGKIEYGQNEVDYLPGSKAAWLTEYLSSIFEYLQEKGMSHKSMDIFNAALEVSESHGISSISMPTKYLRQMIISYEEKKSTRPDKKISPDDKRDLIFRAAVKIFAEKGFHKATMDEIASQAGMGKGSIYRHFKSKEELLRQLLNEKYEEIMKRIIQIFSRERDVLQQIKEMIEVWIDFIEKNHVVYRLIQNESIGLIVGENAMFYDYLITHLPMLKEKILAMNKESRLKTTNFYTVFYGILGFIDGVVQKWFRRGMNYSLQEEVPIIIEVLFNGFVGASSSGTN